MQKQEMYLLKSLSMMPVCARKILLFVPWLPNQKKPQIGQLLVADKLYICLIRNRLFRRFPLLLFFRSYFFNASIKATGLTNTHFALSLYVPVSNPTLKNSSGVTSFLTCLAKTYKPASYGFIQDQPPFA